MVQRISDDSIQRVRDYDDIVGIVSGYVSLKKRGRNYIGLCPFHSEKSPSFTVSPEKKLFHCFGCHESGDHIAFLMKMDNLAFYEAVEQIAGRGGITLDYVAGSRSPEKDRERALARDALLLAKEAFVNVLQSQESVKAYLKQRGVSVETISKFQLGFSGGDGALSFLKSKGVSPAIMLASGMAYTGDRGGLLPRFKNRLIFPIVDHLGRVVGFGGRILDAQSKMAKYVNSEESDIFNKRRILYGFYQAMASIKQEKSVILMEGYMDVLMAHQCGFCTAVAAMGTALTRDQVQFLDRHAETVYLAMDQDESGQRAMVKSYDILRHFGLKVLVVRLEDEDPADLLLQNDGVDQFQSALLSAQPMILFYFERLLKESPHFAVEDVSKILDKMCPLLMSERDPIVRQHYLKILSNRLKIDSELIVDKMQKRRYNVRDRLVVPEKKSKFQKAEEQLIYLCASSIENRAVLFELFSPEHFKMDLHRQLAEVMASSVELNQQLVGVCQDPALARYLSRLLVEGEVSGLSGGYEEIQALVSVLQSSERSETIKDLKEKMKVLEQKGETEQLAVLMEKLQGLLRNDS